MSVGPQVLRGAEEVVRRKAPASLPHLARLLAAGGVSTCQGASAEGLQFARMVVTHPPDAYVLAEAIGALPDWFITHDKAHFLHPSWEDQLDFIVATPGDFLQAFRGQFDSD